MQFTSLVSRGPKQATIEKRKEEWAKMEERQQMVHRRALLHWPFLAKIKARKTSRDTHVPDTTTATQAEQHS